MGLEQYAGMSLEEKVTVMLVKQDNLEEKVDGLESAIAGRPCPAAMCHDHEGRIATLETYFKIMVGAFILVIIPLSVALIGALWGS